MVYYVLVVLSFFFKQKTAYEMRISDWSSDVCSSDLHLVRLVRELRADLPELRNVEPMNRARAHRCRNTDAAVVVREQQFVGAVTRERHFCLQLRRQPRSEEHTSELQSLMRISSAVFCLKKTKTLTRIHTKEMI